jgi:hypothetical protein
MRMIVTIAILVLLFLPQSTEAEELNAGFVRGLWYSTTTPFAGEPVRIYAALRNHTDHDLTGTVRFNVNGKRIGVSYVNALPGRIVEAWVDWTPPYGNHVITAALSEVRLHELGTSPQTVEVVSQLAEDMLFIDYDTDKDGIGNAEDSDDDNDGISDDDEIAQGTDPLVATPKKKPEELKRQVGDLESKMTVAQTPKTSAPERQGLEQYVGDGIIGDMLANVTEKVTSAKESVDTYREKRKTDLSSYFENDTSETTTVNQEPAQLSSSDTATITRSQIQSKRPGFLQSIIDAGGAIFAGFATLFLWLISNILAHPGLVQFLLLIIILYIVYRIARRFGRRPTGY